MSYAWFRILIPIYFCNEFSSELPKYVRGRFIQNTVNFAQKYSKDIVSEDVVQEMKHIAMIYNVSFGSKL
jgi:hypothetical protein